MQALCLAGIDCNLGTLKQNKTKVNSNPITKNIALLSSKGKTATQILKELDLFSAPIKLKPLCLALGLEPRVEYFNENNLLGVISASAKGDIEFFVDCFCDPLNRRVLIAHQLGHFIHDIAPKIESGDAIEFIETRDTLKKNGTHPSAEYRANFFSANLLMPKELMISQGAQIITELKSASVRGKVSGEDFIVKMADIFQVPQKVMKDQLVCLGFIPISKPLGIRPQERIKDISSLIPDNFDITPGF